jgi:hypothetical protein
MLIRSNMECEILFWRQNSPICSYYEWNEVNIRSMRWKPSWRDRDREMEDKKMAFGISGIILEQPGQIWRSGLDVSDPETEPVCWEDVSISSTILRGSPPTMPSGRAAHG